MNWYFKALTQYADFNGRARRKEYWMFVLFNTIFTIAAIIVDSILELPIEGIGYGSFYGIYALTMTIPGFAIVVRRLHDTGKSGWMLFISFIPIIGAIWLFLLLVTEGDAGENAYGPAPKGATDWE